MGLGERAAPVERAGGHHPRTGSKRKPSSRTQGRFAASFGGDELDASLLQMTDLGFLDAATTRVRSPPSRPSSATCKKGPYLFRYVEPDDFGEPETAFNFCTFWFIEALHLNGRDEEAREISRRC